MKHTTSKNKKTMKHLINSAFVEWKRTKLRKNLLFL